jgi:hypothetical protein
MRRIKVIAPNCKRKTCLNITYQTESPTSLRYIQSLSDFHRDSFCFLTIKRYLILIQELDSAGKV